jgi:uncharacterized membrane protein
MDAIKLAFRAVRANFTSVLLLQLLSGLLMSVGALVCCIGMYFVAPITMAAGVIAYRHVFPPVQYADER